MQYIEGPAHELGVIYKIIQDDPMHKGLIELMHRPIHSRDFSDWSMAYCTKDRALAADSGNGQNILDEKLGGSSYKETPARILLHNFWYKTRS